MLKKRLIGVVTVKDGWAVQSFGYNRYLPLGRPECLVENLNRWGADEIIVQVIDRSINDLGPDFSLLDRIGRLGLDTPLIYSGGIHSADDGVQAIQLGADRVIIDAVLHDNPCVVNDLADRLGAQAIIAALPLSLVGGKIEWLDYRRSSVDVLSEEVLTLIEHGIVSEVMVIDWVHEGISKSFDSGLISHFPLKNIALIAFGGLSRPSQIDDLLRDSNISAIALGNFLSYREHSIQKYKEELLPTISLRPASYQSKKTLTANV